MSQDNVDRPEQPKDAHTLADELIRKMDKESSKKLEHISAEEKNTAEGAA